MKSRNSETPSPEQAYRYALRLLTGRDYSAAGMRSKLGARDFGSGDIETTILRLQREGWIDDRRYAERFAAAALSSGRFFGRRLQIEMRRRGFTADIIDEILPPLLEERDEISEIRSVTGRRYPDFRLSAATDRDKRRVIGFLQRKGFKISSIMQALRTEAETC